MQKLKTFFDLFLCLCAVLLLAQTIAEAQNASVGAKADDDPFQQNCAQNDPEKIGMIREFSFTCGQPEDLAWPVYLQLSGKSELQKKTYFPETSTCHFSRRLESFSGKMEFGSTLQQSSQIETQTVAVSGYINSLFGPGHPPSFELFGVTVEGKPVQLEGTLQKSGFFTIQYNSESFDRPCTPRY